MLSKIKRVPIRQESAIAQQLAVTIIIEIKDIMVIGKHFIRYNVSMYSTNYTHYNDGLFNHDSHIIFTTRFKRRIITVLSHTTYGGGTYLDTVVNLYEYLDDLPDIPAYLCYHTPVNIRISYAIKPQYSNYVI